MAGHEEAIETFDKTIEMNPKYADAWFNKGVKPHKLGRYEEVIKAFKKAIEINLKDALACSNLAELFFYSGNIKGASEKIEVALGIDKNLVSALGLQGRYITADKRLQCFAPSPNCLRQLLLSADVIRSLQASNEA